MVFDRRKASISSRMLLGVVISDGLQALCLDIAPRPACLSMIAADRECPGAFTRGGAVYSNS